MNGDLRTQSTISKNHLKDYEKVIISGIIFIEKAERKPLHQGIIPILSTLDGVRKAGRERTEVGAKQGLVVEVVPARVHKVLCGQTLREKTIAATDPVITTLRIH